MLISNEALESMISNIPSTAKVFLLSITQHFEHDPTTIVHYTQTSGGDLRLAVSPPTKSNKTRIRNFATLYWQSRNRVVLSRLYLTPDTLAQLGFRSASAPKRTAEPLLSEIRLSEQDCRTVSDKFITVLERAKVKMVDTF